MFTLCMCVVDVCAYVVASVLRSIYTKQVIRLKNEMANGLIFVLGFFSLAFSIIMCRIEDLTCTKSKTSFILPSIDVLEIFLLFAFRCPFPMDLLHKNKNLL